ncbi:longitudinals lacking protein-like [Hermetia illucens]|uniref:longitudinals lacking protein-like n=1 Tax=Hermetia illucens TaxID=343691 RepID=UPI0018CC47C2|nr:longitudinals lacking protein-like [Hermetia illucens]
MLTMVDYNYSSKYLETLSNFRKAKRFTDIKLQIEDNEIFAHRTVLSAASPVFTAMLDENYAGGKKNSLVLFYETTAPVTQAILDYMYSGRLDIEMKHVDLLLRNLDYLEMEDAKKECERALITNINFGNCFGILVLAII